MKKSVVIFLHLLYWLPKLIIAIYFIVLSAKDSIQTDHSSIYIYSNSVGIIVGLASFYIFYFYLFPVFLAEKRIFLFVLYGLMTWIILSFVIYFVVNLKISINLIGTDIVNNWYRVALYPSVSSVLYSGMLGSLLKGFITWYSEIRVKEQLVKKNLQSELALLKAQINPHFLFNTINNIDILIQKDAKAASRYLNQLSDMMRFMLYETSSDFIPLEKELEYIKKYIELQKIRTANEKYVNLSITGSEENVMIAPAIFIPFIENAFKHSTNKKIENAINIAIEIEKNEITFTCINYFENSETFKQAESGLGLDLIRQRLHLLYKENHLLDIVKKENHFEVKLKIKTA